MSKLIVIFMFFISILNSIEIGDHLVFSDIKYSDNMILESSGQLRKFIDINEKDINYKVAYDTDLQVTFISTTDSSFITEEGFRCGINGTFYSQLKKKEVRYERGWAYIIKLKNNWCAAIIPSNFDNPLLESEMQITFFFQRVGLNCNEE